MTIQGVNQMLKESLRDYVEIGNRAEEAQRWVLKIPDILDEIARGNLIGAIDAAAELVRSIDLNNVSFALAKAAQLVPSASRARVGEFRELSARMDEIYRPGFSEAVTHSAIRDLTRSYLALAAKMSGEAK